MMRHVGIDEAGRGPLAGPVAVGLVHVPEGFDLPGAFPGLNDSKKLTEKARERIFGLLEEQAARGTLSYAVEMREAEEIDERGIAVVIREAVAAGLETLCGEAGPEAEFAEREVPDVHVFLDGALRAPSIYRQETVIKGDSLIPAIMLASVAAKVTRDRRMTALAAQYPTYGFERHKGYGTSAHYEALRAHGCCAIHRRTFIHLDQTA